MRRRPAVAVSIRLSHPAPLIALCASVLAGAALERDLPPFAAPAAAAEPGVVELLRANGAEVDTLGNLGGLEGYRVRPKGEPEGYTLYVTETGHAVMGLLYSPDGHLLTAEQLATSATAEETRAHTATNADTREVEGHGFTLGHAGPTIRVFADPACRWSRGTVARLAAAALDGRLVLKVVPVALLGENSARMALGAVGTGAAEAWFGQAAAERTDELAARVRRNNDLFAAEGGTAVPLVMWQGPHGTVRHTGSIDDIAALLAEIDP